MKKLVVIACGVTLLASLAGAGFAASGIAASVKIPFAFMVKDKEMPAGRYEIRVEGDGSRLVMQGADGSAGPTILPVLTRLAELGGTQVDVVFDNADGKHYLSEVHLPGRDGFALPGAPGAHTHTKVTASE